MARPAKQRHANRFANGPYSSSHDSDKFERFAAAAAVDCDAWVTDAAAVAVAAVNGRCCFRCRAVAHAEKTI